MKTGVVYLTEKGTPFFTPKEAIQRDFADTLLEISQGVIDKFYAENERSNIGDKMEVCRLFEFLAKNDGINTIRKCRKAYRRMILDIEKYQRDSESQ